MFLITNSGIIFIFSSVALVTIVPYASPLKKLPHLPNACPKSNAGIIIKSKYTFKSSLYKKDEESKTVFETLIENQEKKE